MMLLPVVPGRGSDDARDAPQVRLPDDASLASTPEVRSRSRQDRCDGRVPAEKAPTAIPVSDAPPSVGRAGALAPPAQVARVLLLAAVVGPPRTRHGPVRRVEHGVDRGRLNDEGLAVTHEVLQHARMEEGLVTRIARERGHMASVQRDGVRLARPNPTGER